MFPAILALFNRFKRHIIGAIGMPLVENALSKLYFDMAKDEADSQIESQSFLTYKRHATMMVEQAFKDMDFKGKVHVQFKRVPKAETTEIDLVNVVAVASHRDLKEGDIALVELFYREPRNIQQLTPRQIYAAAGQQAVHVTHHHSIIDGVRRGLFLGEAFTNFRFGKLPMVFFANYAISLCMSKLMTYDADITSTLKLNTSTDLISFLGVYAAKHRQQQNSMFNTYLTEEQKDRIGDIDDFVDFYDSLTSPLKILDPLPSFKNRTNVIQFFKLMYGAKNSQFSLLFKSPAYQQILRERDAHESDTHQSPALGNP